MERKVYRNPRKSIVKKLDFQSIDFSNFRKLEYPIPSEGGSVEMNLFDTNAASNASKASDNLLRAMDKQIMRSRY